MADHPKKTGHKTSHNTGHKTSHNTHSSDDEVQNILQLFAGQEGNRGTWDDHWKDVARFVSPTDNVFVTKVTPGARRNRDIYDTTAPLALSRYSSFMDSILTPRNQRWHALEASDPKLNEDQAVTEFFQELTRRLFMMRYQTTANFASQIHECWRSEGAFGTAGLMIDDIPGTGIHYKSIHLSRLYIMENRVGLIDSVFVKSCLTAKVAIETFGRDKVSEEVIKSFEKDQSDRFDYIQYIRPNTNFEENSDDVDKMKYSSTHIAIQDRAIVRESGYSTFPLPVARSETSTDEVYGRSRIMSVLPTIQMLNQMKKTDIRAGHQAVSPTILLKDNSVVKIRDLKPDSAIVGGLDIDGKPNMMAFNTGVRPDISEGKMEIEQDAINRAMLVDLYQMAAEREMTATEVMHRAKEQSLLLSSTTGRHESEFLGPIITRELDIMQLSGKFPDIPPALLEAKGQFEVVYTNPMSRAQKAEGAIGADVVVRSIMELSQVKPSVLDKLDEDAYVDLMVEAQGAPAKMINSTEDIEEIRAQRAEAEKTAQDAENLKTVGAGAASMAKAQTEVNSNQDG